MSGVGRKILDAAQEAAAIAKGEKPAAAIWHRGHRYIPEIAATDAPKGKGGAAVAGTAPIQDFAMLNVVQGTKAGKNFTTEVPQNLFSETNMSETRRAKAWLEDRIEKGRNEVFSEVVALTPALAELLLERNAGNRNLRARAVETYRTDIVNGDWALNGESIKLSRDGFMNDGQHRCHAVVAAARPIQTVVLFGVERESRMTVDQGAVRTPGNYLSMAGHENANQLAAVASLLWQYEHFGLVNNPNKIMPTKVQIAQVVAEHPGLSDSIKAIPSSARVGRSRSVLAFCHYLLARRSKTHADAFMLRLVLGDGLSRKDPIYHCRERLLAPGRFDAAPKVEMILRTWNAHRRGQVQTKCSPVLGELPKIER